MKPKNEIVTDVIKNLGIPASMEGFNYVRCAILLAADDLTYINAITKRLYPAVAKEFDTTMSRCERAIRYAIECGWRAGNESLQNILFGYTVNQDKGRPTNGEFIATIADWVNTADYRLVNGDMLVDTEAVDIVTNGVPIRTLFGMPLDELAELIRAKQEGRIIVPPCKVGDTVFAVLYDGIVEEWYISEETVTEVGSKGFYLSGYCPPRDDMTTFINYKEFGKEFYLTREEAEEALAERSGE